MKYKKFKLGEDNEIGSADILVHAVQFLDHAGRLAVATGNLEGMIDVYDRLLGASEQLIALTVHEMEFNARMAESQEGEGEIVTIGEREEPFGFHAGESVGGEEIE